MKKKNNTGIVIMGVLMISIFIAIFTIVIPAKMTSDVPGMTTYLSKNGYKNIKQTELNGWTKTVYFTAVNENNKTEEVKVRYSNNGCYQIVY